MFHSRLFSVLLILAPFELYGVCLNSSHELRAIVKSDQADRKPPIDWSVVSPRDEHRRKRVGEIASKGCLKTAEDFYAAALVFQHGSVPNHFFQTYLWAKKSSSLGNRNAKHLMALGVDRYLVQSGMKQLFGSQASKAQKCWCLQQVESSFPEVLRKDYFKKSLLDQYEWISELNARSPSCSKVRMCTHSLKPSPKGSVEGFW